MKKLQPSNQQQPIGHYGPETEHYGLIDVSGQLPMSVGTLEPFAGDIGEQPEPAMRNAETVLKESGSDLDQVLSITIYVSDKRLRDAVNRNYVEVMGEHRSERGDDTREGSAF
jgi:enamine deaminase RidA (YjgF/YER057c/UK114 family)